MKSRSDEQELYRFVREPDEQLLYQYSNTAHSLRREGAGQFLVPASGGGVILMMLGALMMRLFSDGAGRMLCPVLVFLGMLLIAGGVILYAMFARRARDAEGVALYVTSRNVIYISGGTYARLPISEITGADTQRADRLGRVPFDISALEAHYLTLIYRGAEMRLPYIDRPEDAAERIRSLIFCDDAAGHRGIAD